MKKYTNEELDEGLHPAMVLATLIVGALAMLILSAMIVGIILIVVGLL